MECVFGSGRGGVGGVGGERVTGLGLGFTNSGGTLEKWDMCLVVVVLGERGWAAWTRVLEGGMVLCLCVL